MTNEYLKNEISYAISLQMITNLLDSGLITEQEYKEINKLNIISFNPQNADVCIWFLASPFQISFIVVVKVF